MLKKIFYHFWKSRLDDQEISQIPGTLVVISDMCILLFISALSFSNCRCSSITLKSLIVVILLIVAIHPNLGVQSPL